MWYYCLLVSLPFHFPIILVCAMIFCIVILCLDHMILLIMATMSNLSRWLCWDDGCLMWVFVKYTLLRLYVRMKMCVLSVLCSL